MTTSKKPFVRAEEGLNNSVVYYDEDGNNLLFFRIMLQGEGLKQNA